MDQGTLEGIGTALALVAFLGICWWAFSKHKKKDFEEASRLPFDEDELKGDKPTERSEGDTERHD